MSGETTAHRIAILVFDGVTPLDMSGPGEVLHEATALGHPYEVDIVSPAGGMVTTSAGVRLSSTAAADAATPETLIVAGGALTDGALDSALLTAAARLADSAQRVASVCTGAFVLAELGLLDGHRATTHWRHTGTLARRFPRIQVETDALHVHDGRYLTSAGISAGIDMTLALLEHDHGAGVARTVAQELVMFMQRPGGQSQFSHALSTPPARTEPLRAAIDSVLTDPAGAHTTATMAAVAGVSPRHLTRLFHADIGSTPARWLERVRVEHAQQLLLQGYTVTATAHRSGLGTDETLRRAFARHLGLTPTDYKHRFITTAPTNTTLAP
ncbi:MULTISPECIES: GlxA family transcriptional regulator [Nocardia]|uniref:GlxA family transcriptional regulator n=1 Tax=Nocardia TaxID=1817 RepID=UPI000A9E9F62|nr:MULTISPECIES: DJ-1/PfpI family protein [Nocardia]